MLNLTPPAGAGVDRLTVKVNVVVPLLPSFNETLLIESVGLTFKLPAPSCPPARARMLVMPEARAVAVVDWPVLGDTVAFVASLESQTKETFWTSTSVPLLLLKALAVKFCVWPILMAAEAGATSMRVIAGEPKGVPSVRVPGLKTRPSEFATVECFENAPVKSGERVKD